MVLDYNVNYKKKEEDDLEKTLKRIRTGASMQQTLETKLGTSQPQAPQMQNPGTNQGWGANQN